MDRGYRTVESTAGKPVLADSPQCFLQGALEPAERVGEVELTLISKAAACLFDPGSSAKQLDSPSLDGDSAVQIEVNAGQPFVDAPHWLRYELVVQAMSPGWIGRMGDPARLRHGLPPLRGEPGDGLGPTTWAPGH